jgi:UDPglucose 6-dehydrogenase
MLAKGNVPMRVCVFGLWHLGSVTAACLAAAGHDVVGLDADEPTIAGLSAGKPPLFEPGLDDLVAAGIASGWLRFTSVPAAALEGVEVLWVTFDTPVDDEDRADVAFVVVQVAAVLPLLSEGAVVLVSSQLPVGSIARLEALAAESCPHLRLAFACSPENLRLGKAIQVFQHPDRVVVGIRPVERRIVVERLLAPITNRLEWMSPESAEMTKHAINAFLAISVTFANELASICEDVGADAKEVERGLKTEVRIGPKAYLSPGGPFAGGTLARDIAFLNDAADAAGLVVPLLGAVRPSNDLHKLWTHRALNVALCALAGARVAIWGLTYKPGTDTLRRSLAVELCDWLLDQGALVQVFDPAVKEIPERWVGRVVMHGSALDATHGAQALVVGTEWPEFREQATLLRIAPPPSLVVIDPNRHLAAALHGSGLRYLAVGTRPQTEGTP